MLIALPERDIDRRRVSDDKKSPFSFKNILEQAKKVLFRFIGCVVKVHVIPELFTERLDNLSDSRLAYTCARADRIGRTSCIIRDVLYEIISFISRDPNNAERVANCFDGNVDFLIALER